MRRGDCGGCERRVRQMLPDVGMQLPQQCRLPGRPPQRTGGQPRAIRPCGGPIRRRQIGAQERQVTVGDSPADSLQPGYVLLQLQAALFKRLA